MSGENELRVVRASEIQPRSEDQPPWLIEGLWGMGAVGVIGGAPKSCKSWLSLEMAVAVASGRPCLGRYEVPQPGSVLVYAAEDEPIEVRNRLENLCRARGSDFERLDVGLILEPCLRIDRPEDLARLHKTLARLRPKFLVLDPYVRLQSVDENNSTEVSQVLGSLRVLSRTFGLALALVHHARKTPTDQAGQALRGSSDFYAWADSILYLCRRGEDLVLSTEHRSARSPAPLGLRIATDDGPVRLEIRDIASGPPEVPLAQKILGVLAERGPLWQEDLRKVLRVRKQDVIDTLRGLEKSRRVLRTQQGWILANGP